MSYFLRFPTTEALDKAMSAFKNEDGVVVPQNDFSIDYIGQIEGIDGWHVNLAGELPDGWEQYQVFPEHPVREWL